METVKYKIIVSEPWNYDGPDGQNLIVGEILKPLSSNCIVFLSNNLIEFGNQKGRILVLRSRYKEGLLERSGKYRGTVNGGLLLPENFEGKDEKYLEEHCEFVLTGTLEET